VAWASSLSPDSSTSMRDLAKTGVHNDAAAYNEFASASVDLSDAHVSKDGLFTGTNAPTHRSVLVTLLVVRLLTAPLFIFDPRYTYCSHSFRSRH
jgi:hypothetical protein